MRSIVAICVVSLTSLAQTNGQETKSYDVVVYGGTSAGVTAAVQTSRMGKSVVMIETGKHVGGLTTGGLGWTDSGNKSVIGGMSREFYQRVHKYYENDEVWVQEQKAKFGRFEPNSDAMWTFEPKVAEQILLAMLKEANVPVVFSERLKLKGGVTKKDGAITEIEMESGRKFAGKRFIDSTYEGDLLAEAGVSYHVGREAAKLYGETLNGVQKVRTDKHQFIKQVDPYVKAGDPKSGLLPGINTNPGEDGDGDHRLQAYNYRVCMTDAVENRVPFAKPEGYDPLEYELLLRNFEAGDLRLPMKIDMMPNRKTDLNNNNAVSTDFIGRNYDYPDADYATRAKILQAHETYIRGLLWTMAYHPRSPEKIRQQVSRWGLAKDEFTDTNNWPHTAYIREARRMVSDYVHTEKDCRRQIICTDPVGMGSYNMDSHNCQRYVTPEGHVRNEGDIQVSPGGPYLISYKTIVPKKDQCTNLLVPVCLSSSHIAFGSIRMEPVFMILGQSAATAACQSIDAGVIVQDVDYAKLRTKMVDDGQVLDLPPNLGANVGVNPAKLTGLVVDDAQAKKTGEWLKSSSVGKYVGEGYLHDDSAGQGQKTLQFELPVKEAGLYEVRLSYTPNANRASNVSVVVKHDDGETTVAVNQKTPPKIDGLFVSLGKFTLSPKQASVVISNTAANGYVVADAVQAVPLKKE